MSNGRNISTPRIVGHKEQIKRSFQHIFFFNKIINVFVRFIVIGSYSIVNRTTIDVYRAKGVLPFPVIHSSADSWMKMKNYPKFSLRPTLFGQRCSVKLLSTTLRRVISEKAEVMKWKSIMANKRMNSYCRFPFYHAPIFPSKRKSAASCHLVCTAVNMQCNHVAGVWELRKREWETDSICSDASTVNARQTNGFCRTQI